MRVSVQRRWGHSRRLVRAVMRGNHVPVEGRMPATAVTGPCRTGNRLFSALLKCHRKRIKSEELLGSSSSILNGR
jgi:hypothetical protein